MPNREFASQIEQIQNLLDTSVDEQERRIIRRLLAEEKAVVALQTEENTAAASQTAGSLTN
jgi:hypothetical protein